MCSGTQSADLLFGGWQVTDADTFAHMVSGSFAGMMKSFLPRSIERGSGSCVCSILNLYRTARHRAHFGGRVHHMLSSWSSHHAANLRQRFCMFSFILEVLLFGKGRRRALRLCETLIFSILCRERCFLLLRGDFLAPWVSGCTSPLSPLDIHAPLLPSCTQLSTLVFELVRYVHLQPNMITDVDVLLNSH